MKKVYIPSAAIVAVMMIFTAAVRAQSLSIARTEVRLEPSGAEIMAHDQFGSVVAMSANGNTLAVAGITTDDGAISEVGAIFIFDRVQNLWKQVAKLFPSGGIEDETFGFNMAISADGNTVVAAALNPKTALTNQGAVFVFQRTNNTWVQQAEILSPTPSTGDFFGTWGLGISGDTMAVGDLGNSANGFTPGVDVFTQSNGAWQLSTTIQLPNDFDFSPSSNAIDGDTLVVGTGTAAYVFTQSNGTWTPQSKLTTSDAPAGSQFGAIVAIDGNVIAVGAPSAPGHSAFSGAAYIFSNQSNHWRLQAKVAAEDGVAGDLFGIGLSLKGGTLGIGAPGHTTSAGPGAGTAYLYQVKDNKWTRFAELVGSDVVAGGGFGTSVAIENGTLLVGGPGQHPQVNNVPYPEGEAYFYKIK